MISLKEILKEAINYNLQVFVPGSAKFDPEKLPIGKLKIKSPYSAFGVEKPDGAFWTSSYDNVIKTSDWSKWTRETMKDWSSNEAAVFSVIGSPKVFHIATPEDYKKLRDTFTIDYKEALKYGIEALASGIHWENVSKRYDAVHLVDYWKARGSRENIQENPAYIGLSSWDVESTAWFDMGFLKFKGMIKP